MKKKSESKSNVKSCATCRWVGCKNYGYKNKSICINYIDEKQ